jgi:hypothetical protein
MLENSLESISALFSSGDFPRVVGSDRDDVISIYNRRMSTRLLRGNSNARMSGGGSSSSDVANSVTQYAMLRAWVQDDPDRSSQLQSVGNVSAAYSVHFISCIVVSNTSNAY